MWTIVLLVISNVFMTFAWYGHLKYPHAPLWATILVSWMIALPEYGFQVPANRMGKTHYQMSAAQLKITQEFITLVVFAIFSYAWLGQKLRWNQWLALGLVLAGVIVGNAFNTSDPHDTAELQAEQ